MQEHRAASARNPGPGIVIHLDDDVIQAVVAPEPVAWFIGRTPEWPVIAAVAGVLAPGHVAVDTGGRQQGQRPWAAVGPPPQPPQAELASWCGPVAFALIGANPRAAEHHRNGQPARNQHSAA